MLDSMPILVRRSRVRTILTLALLVLASCNDRNPTGGGVPPVSTIKDDACLVLKRFQIGGKDQAAGNGPLLTIHADGSVEASGWLVLETGFQFQSHIDPSSAKRLIAKCSGFIGDFAPFTVLREPNYMLTVTNGTDSHETAYVRVVIDDRLVGPSEEGESAEEKAKSVQWNAMMAEIAKLVVKK